MNDAPASDTPHSPPGDAAMRAGHDASADAPAHGNHGSRHGEPVIVITANAHRVRVIHRGVTFADTHGALTVSETGHADVVYFPRADVNMARLVKSPHTTQCPFKGEASYFHLHTEDELIEDAAWTYQAPHERVKQIAGYLAFHASHVDRIDQTS